jgi:hypothetical protein
LQAKPLTSNQHGNSPKPPSTKAALWHRSVLCKRSQRFKKPIASWSFNSMDQEFTIGFPSFSTEFPMFARS